MINKNLIPFFVAGVVIGDVIPEPYIWYISITLVLVVVFQVLRVVVVLVRADPYE